jgi:nitrate/nitrite transporter NarK
MKSSVIKIWTRSTHRYTAIAAILRAFGGMAAATYLPIYFLKCFPAYKNEYAMMNALSLGLFGLISSLLGGIISDKYEEKNLMAKSLVCAIGSFVAFPLTAMCCLT